MLDVCLPPQRIVHRDLKAENVLVGSDGHVKLCDFGLAHMHESDDDDRLKGVFGTWLYQVRRLRFAGWCSWRNVTADIARVSGWQGPECFTGKAYSGRAADVYAVGVILFRMATGRMPYTGKTQRQVQKALKRVAKVPRAVNPALANLINRMLEKDPSKRITLAQARVHTYEGQAGCGLGCEHWSADNVARTQIRDHEREECVAGTDCAAARSYLCVS